MKTLNSFIIKISFATQTSGKSRLGRENWRMGLDKRVPVRGRKLILFCFIEFSEMSLDKRVPVRGRKPLRSICSANVSFLDKRVPVRGRKLTSSSPKVKPSSF